MVHSWLQATDLPETGPGLTWSNLEHWVDAHPEVLLVDPLWAVRQVTFSLMGARDS